MRRKGILCSMQEHVSGTYPFQRLQGSKRQLTIRETKGKKLLNMLRMMQEFSASPKIYSTRRWHPHPTNSYIRTEQNFSVKRCRLRRKSVLSYLMYLHEAIFIKKNCKPPKKNVLHVGSLPCSTASRSC